MPVIPTPGQLLDGPSGKESIRLEEPIGSGAFGVVFRGTDLKMSRQVAVKFPQVGPFDSEAEMRAFANEVKAAQEIKHPNVVQVLHVNLEPRAAAPYLVMEFVGGGTLRGKINEATTAKTQIPLEQLHLWMLQLVDGMEAVNNKMLHRDLKPDNILVGPNGLKIGDFGLSKIVGATTRSHTFKGGQHILYMAPEGWKLETNDIQIDMYSLAIVFFEMAALAFPYELPRDPRDIDGIRKMHLFQSPKNLHALRSDIPIEVVQVIQRMLEKRAAERFKDWNEVENALRIAWESRESVTKASLPAVENLLRQVTSAYEKETAAKLAHEREAAEQQERQEIDLLQKEKLLTSLSEAVEAFNERSAVGKIRIARELNGVFFRLPYGRSIEIFFFDTWPPVEVLGGTVRFFAWVRDSVGYGFNYLLIRAGEEDIYGTWQICRVRYNPLSSRHGIEPFGFNDVRTFREHMPWSKGGTHIYTYEFRPVDPNSLLQLAVEAISRVQRV